MKINYVFNNIWTQGRNTSYFKRWLTCRSKSNKQMEGDWYKHWTDLRCQHDIHWPICKLNIHLSFQCSLTNENNEPIYETFFFSYFLQQERIRVWMNSTLMNRMEHLFVEGETVRIENFLLEQYQPSDKEKCFEDDRFIKLTSKTKILETLGFVSLIPRNFSVFTNLCEMSAHKYRESSYIGNKTFN